jgi:hypothetical protein
VSLLFDRHDMMWKELYEQLCVHLCVMQILVGEEFIFFIAVRNDTAVDEEE